MKPRRAAPVLVLAFASVNRAHGIALHQSYTSVRPKIAGNDVHPLAVVMTPNPIVWPAGIATLRAPESKSVPVAPVTVLVVRLVAAVISLTPNTAFVVHPDAPALTL